VSEPRVLTLEELKGMPWGHGWLECYLTDEDGKLVEATDLMEIVWMRGHTIEMDPLDGMSYGTVESIMDEYNTPGGSRIWTEEPTRERMDRTKWTGK
jgi:hypothetical protein